MPVTRGLSMQKRELRTRVTGQKVNSIQAVTQSSECSMMIFVFVVLTSTLEYFHMTGVPREV